MFVVVAVVVVVVAAAVVAAVVVVCLLRLFAEAVSSNKRVHYDDDMVRGKHLYYHYKLL
jgi:hypothetical protein